MIRRGLFGVLTALCLLWWPVSAGAADSLDPVDTAGVVQAHAAVYVITDQSDAAATVEAALDELAGSAWARQVGATYGLSPPVLAGRWTDPARWNDPQEAVGDALAANADWRSGPDRQFWVVGAHPLALGYAGDHRLIPAGNLVEIDAGLAADRAAAIWITAHEWSEAVTDPGAGTGWTVPGRWAQNEDEIADVCESLGPGPGGWPQVAEPGRGCVQPASTTAG